MTTSLLAGSAGRPWHTLYSGQGTTTTASAPAPSSPRWSATRTGPGTEKACVPHRHLRRSSLASFQLRANPHSAAWTLVLGLASAALRPSAALAAGLRAEHAPTAARSDAGHTGAAAGRGVVRRHAVLPLGDGRDPARRFPGARNPLPRNMERAQRDSSHWQSALPQAGFCAKTRCMPKTGRATPEGVTAMN